ncbi:MAG: ABC transporter permease [Anaerolineaceae bacterium]|jgi:ABC-2 type transport system permease protein
MAKVRKVFAFEFFNLISKKSFILSLILVPLIPSLIFFVLGKLNQEQTQSLSQIFVSEVANPLPIGVVDQSGLVSEYPTWLTKGELIEIADEATARAQTEQNQLEGFFIIAPDYLESGQVTFIKPEINMVTEIVKQGALDDLINYNLMGQDQDLYLKYSNPVTFNYNFVNEETADKRDQDSPMTVIVPYLITMLFYMVIMIGAAFMINAVGKDKDNKTIEILLTSSNPHQLFFGKLLAYGTASLLQLLSWVAAIFLVSKIGGASLSYMQGFDIPVSLALWALPFFTLGYMIYGSLMAGIGAMAPNIREGNQSSFILMLPLIFVLMNIYQLIDKPHGAFSVILSLFPLTSPVAMMTRISIGQVPLWQILLSILILVLFVILVIRAVANLFSSQTLLSGDKFNVQTFLKTLFVGK